ncbi:hypothetical protein BH23CHL8_BH23CHL8_19420 [soil metagenome]
MAARHKTLKRGAGLLVTGSLVLTVAPGALAQEGEPILVGHLNYYTGAFADVGDWFRDTTDFTVDIINQDPPLGRPFEVLEGDIGTEGEGPVALRFMESDGVHILLNPAHGYSAYRDSARDFVADNDLPLMPTVHGGGIPPSIGGVAEEPIFRAQPQDSGQASVAILEAQNRGAETIAIIATQVDGSQFMKQAAVSAANELGLEIVAGGPIDVEGLQADYSSVINRVRGADPDAVFIASQAQDGGTMVKQMAEAGMTDVEILGSSEWTGTAFVDSSTREALEAHKSSLVAGGAPSPGPAFDAYVEGWNASEYADVIDPANSYNIAYHDALVLAALTIEKAGEVSASSYANTIRDVAMEPGTQCYAYQECLDLVRAGEDVDYEGTSGSTNFTETGVIDGTPAVQEWEFGEDGSASLVHVSTPDPAAVADLENAFNATLPE